MTATFLVVKNEKIVLSNHPEIEQGDLLQSVAAIFLDTEISECYLIGTQLYQCLCKLNQIASEQIPGWIMRFSARRRTKLGHKITTARDIYVDYIAMEYRSNGRRTKRKKITVLNLELLIEKPPRTAASQLRMAENIVDIQKKRGVKRIKVTRGSIGAALYRRSPYWEKGRHAVYRRSNEYARKLLPGNFFALSRKEENKQRIVIPSIFYLDQPNAHHNIAAEINLPHPHFCKIRGFGLVDLKKKHHPCWINRTSPVFDCILNGHYTGVFLAKINSGIIPPTEYHLYPQWVLEKKAYVWIWTPEFRLIQSDRRLQLDSFVAGIGGSVGDPVAREYSEWCLNYLEDNSWGKQYTKSILLAAYGMFAFNPQNSREVYRYWSGDSDRGVKVILPEVGPAYERIIKMDDQHNMCNVIARGVIEAETRMRSLEYAKELHSQGYHVAAVYADALLVETDQMPFVKHGWKLDQELTNVIIHRQNAFTSDQMNRLPGIPRLEQEMNWLRYREEALRPLDLAI